MKPVWTAAGKSPDELVRYWTPERMGRAKPYEPRLTDGSGAGENSGTSLVTSHALGSGPVGRSVGKVFFEERGVAHFCSGTGIDSANASVVLTAGHCVADGGSCAKGGDCRPHQNWIFVPSFREGASCREDTGPGCPFGRYAPRVLYAPDEWRRDGNHRYDFAAVVVEPRQKEFALASNAGGIPVVFGVAPRTLAGRRFQVFGYPAASSFNGRLWICAAKGAARNQSRYGWFAGSTRSGPEPGPAELMTACDMTGGADGGPWLTQLKDGATVLVSVSSFGPTGKGATVSGPYLGEVAKRIYDLATSVKVES